MSTPASCPRCGYAMEPNLLMHAYSCPGCVKRQLRGMALAAAPHKARGKQKVWRLPVTAKLGGKAINLEWDGEHLVLWLGTRRIKRRLLRLTATEVYGMAKQVAETMTEAQGLMLRRAVGA